MKRTICRVLNAFPGAFYRTPGKDSLPKARARASRQSNPPGKSAFAGGRAPGKVQPSANNLLCRRPTPDKTRPSAKVVGGLMANGRQPLPRVTPLGTRQRIFFKNFFAGCLLPAKKPLPGAKLSFRQNIFFIFCFLALFFCVHLIQ